jgi:serine/threonine protein kinase
MNAASDLRTSVTRSQSVIRRTPIRYNCLKLYALGPGTRLGPYEILSPIGAGGMGEVYKGRDTRRGCYQALRRTRHRQVGLEDAVKLTGNVFST